MEDGRQRSRAYPGYGLQECVGWIGMVRARLGSGVHDREEIANSIGSKGLTGASTRKLAALVHFGFLRKEKDGYTLSSLSERVTRPISESERQQAIAEAFIQPELYKEVLERCQADGSIPSMLPSILVRYHRIHDVAADDAAKVFLESGRFAGIIDENGRILHAHAAAQTETGTDGDDESEKRSNRQQEDLVAKVIKAIPPVVESEQEFKLALAGGRVAKLTVPYDLRATDVQLLQKQLEVLELQVRLSEGIVRGTETDE